VCRMREDLLIICLFEGGLVAVRPFEVTRQVRDRSLMCI
jgi:hypothetical protein